MRSGQTVVILLAFMVIAMTITMASVSLTASNSQGSTRQEVGIDVYAIAESGAENGLIRLLRDPAYVGETLTVGNGTATIVVGTAGSVTTITSTGRIGDFERVVQVTTNTAAGVMSITSWQEIYP
ncbi:hypothetical protein A2397_05520 [Candidatus Amesbacteria bacterium RIFOXYB1_FULL_44_23]|uniref:Type 4 fimbrial biogenesis protein PilX N-terminal domain-containing protein n=1 Tax=Candidatus Amesbacteria bacterium RIFOXYB1_FULL_44_23 TaxID=1797263 RepID=A0A1F4ZPD4_9BACT|nr:MAG: hypothetical protein A2397_05520 [Candidatus Amesbacteria bacterium RIFOXYB1_FULL_44_23]